MSIKQLPGLKELTFFSKKTRNLATVNLFLIKKNGQVNVFLSVVIYWAIFAFLRDHGNFWSPQAGLATLLLPQNLDLGQLPKAPQVDASTLKGNCLCFMYNYSSTGWLWHARPGLRLIICICLDLRPEKDMREAWECDLRCEGGHILYFD